MHIAIADDEALFRKGIDRLLKEFGATLSFEAKDGQDLLQKMEFTKELPDIILMDLNMPLLNGVDASKIIVERYPEIKIIVLSSYYSEEFILNMVDIGASGYLAKNATLQEMEITIKEVYHKGFYYSNDVLEVINSQKNKKNRPVFKNQFGVSISDRELEVLKLICDELTTTEIAKELYISPRTVDGHRNNLLLKLDCRNTAGLVITALKEELVDINKIKFNH